MFNAKAPVARAVLFRNLLEDFEDLEIRLVTDASGFFSSDGVPPSAPAQVTRAVGRYVTEYQI